MAKITVDEMIRKFSCRLGEKDGVKGIRFSGKPGKLQMEQLRANKAEIMAELERREAARVEREAVAKAKEDAELEALRNGTEKIKTAYYDGEYLSGYSPVGQASKLLSEIGLGKYVSGWGYHIPSQAIEALGEEFTYQEAIEYMRPAREAAEAKKAAKEAERQAKFAEAKETGEKVLLRRWSTDCCDRREECSTDIHYEWAMPDGSTKHEWNHTW